MSIRQRAGSDGEPPRLGRAPIDLVGTLARFEALKKSSRPVEIQLTAQQRAGLLDRAINGLHDLDSSLSAKPGVAPQTVTPVLLLLLGLGLLALRYEAWALVLTLIVTLPFACIAVGRVAAIAELLRTPARPLAAQPAIPDDALPRYTILVPLMDEVLALPGLIKSLCALDYPRSQLEIILVLEEQDWATQTAVRGIGVPAHIRYLVVPAGGPQTKPKALNVALGLVTGKFIVVYDAEDRPEPGQLRDALACFAAAGTDLVCVQARLNIYNPDASRLTRQFTLEYSALFDGLLPALERWRLPLPLGGTSNHLRVDQLREIGAWDAFNVTEDADLGLRLARAGYRTATIASTTWEEAPSSWIQWRGQRTRWLKGWLQTYIVHMRDPGRLLRDLGVMCFLGVQVLMGSVLLSVLVHPWAYVMAGGMLWSGRFDPSALEGPSRWLWWFAVGNFCVGMLLSSLLGALAVARRGRAYLAVHAISMPFYWLAISYAGYRALRHLIKQPFHWEKTDHAGDGDTGGHGGGHRAKGTEPRRYA